MRFDAVYASIILNSRQIIWKWKSIFGTSCSSVCVHDGQKSMSYSGIYYGLFHLEIKAKYAVIHTYLWPSYNLSCMFICIRSRIVAPEFFFGGVTSFPPVLPPLANGSSVGRLRACLLLPHVLRATFLQNPSPQAPPSPSPPFLCFNCCSTDAFPLFVLGYFGTTFNDRFSIFDPILSGLFWQHENKKVPKCFSCCRHRSAVI